MRKCSNKLSTHVRISSFVVTQEAYEFREEAGAMDMLMGWQQGLSESNSLFAQIGVTP